MISVAYISNIKRWHLLPNYFGPC